MQIVQSNLFDSTADYILVTTNAFVKRNGCLVMGRGAAKQLYDLDPMFSYYAGQVILDGGYPLDPKSGKPVYGVIIFNRFGLFQVKANWWEDARLDLIENSVDDLMAKINSQYINNTFAINFPGIGNGRLKEDDVLKIIKRFPNTVTIHKF